MKRFLVFLLVLAIAVGGVYIWWQFNAHRFLTQEMKRIGRSFFVNADSLSVENGPVVLTGLREAKVSKLIISGDELVLRDGPILKHAKLILKDVYVSGPPFNISRLNGGVFTATVTDTAVTEYLHKRGGGLRLVAKIPLDSVTVKFAKAGASVLAQIPDPLFGKPLSVTASGKLVPSSKIGQIDYQVRNVAVSGVNLAIKPVIDALGVLNPVVNVSEWPIMCEFTHIATGDGIVTLTAQISGLRQRSLLP